jgi:hypothetical protein
MLGLVAALSSSDQCLRIAATVDEIGARRLREPQEGSAVTRAWALLLLVLLMPGSALSDSSNLEGGVFIAHHPPGLQYTSGQDWCARYFQEFAIDSCSEQNSRIDLDGNQGQSSVWFVLAAWAEEKEWCGAEFGFAQYDSTIYAFISSGPCFPDGSGGGLEIPTAGWPGPNAGVALSISGAPWSGNFVPVYFFAGYAYYQGEMPLAANPSSEFGGTANCETPPQSWAATAFGAMGIFQDGTSACPEELDGGGGGLDGGMQPDGAEGYGGYEPDGGQDWGDGEEGCIDYRDFMHWVGNANPPGSSQDVAVAEAYAYVASGASGLQIVDISNPRLPELKGGADTPSFANAVCVAGGYAYVADGLSQASPEETASLQVVDVSDPESPEVVGSVEMPGGGDAVDVAVSGDYAYVVINTASPGSPGVQVVDITSPTSPQLGPLVPLSAPWSIAVCGNYLYVADNFEGLQVIFMSEQGPQIVGSYNTPEIVARGVALSGSLACVADAEYGLLVIDVSAPENPSLEGSVETPGAACDLAVSGDQAYLSACESGLVAIDISDPADPQIMGRMGTLAAPHGVACTDSYVYVTAGTVGLDVIERANSESSPLTGGVETPGTAGGVTVSGDHAYVADGSSGLQVMNISDPGSSSIVGSVDTPGSAQAVAVAGFYAFVADSSAGLQVVGISDPASPDIVGSAETQGIAKGVVVSGIYAYVADGGTLGEGLMIFDVSAEEPSLKGTYDPSGLEVRAVAVSGNYAYVPVSPLPGDPGVSQLLVINVSDPEHPTLVGDTEEDIHASLNGLAIVNAGEQTFAYVGAAPGLLVFNVTDPGSPSLAGNVSLRRPAEELVVSGEFLYVADEAGGLQVLSISDPDAPALLGGRDRLGDALGVATSDDCVCVAAGSEGLRLLPKQCLVFDWEAYWVQLQNAQPFGVQVQQDSNGSIVVEMTLDGFYAIPEEIDGTTFYHISLPGEPLRMVAEAPELPLVPRSLLVSDDQRMVATVESAVYEDLPALPVTPSKGPLPMGLDPDSVAYVFGPAYTDSAFYPAAPESLGAPFILRDFRGQVLQLNPFQAYPLDSTLRVYTYLKVSISPGGPDTASVIHRSGPPATIDRQFAKIYRKFFSNYPAIEVLGYVPETEDQDLLIVIPWNCTYCDEIDDFAEWKAGQGITTSILSTTGTTFEEVRQDIREAYLADPAIAHVLLVGDADQIPPRLSTLNNQANTPADPPYTFMNDEDHYPDIFVGRFSANNADQLNTQIERTMAYGESQGLWLTRAFGMASHLDDLDGVFDFPTPYGSNPEAMADWLGRLEASGLYATTDLYSENDPTPPPMGMQVTYLLEQLNLGLGLMLVSDHGCVDGWDDDFPHQGIPPNIMRRDVFHDEEHDYVNNTDMLPLIHAQSCDLGRFTRIVTDPPDPWPTECFAESWMWKRGRQWQGYAPQGAIATYMAGGTIDQRGPQYAQLGTILALLDDGSPSIGQLVYFGAVFMMLQGVNAYNFEMWNLFGDPSLVFLKSAGPQTIEVTVNSELRPAEVFRIGPSPSSGPVRVHFTIGGESTGSHAELRVFDLCGRCVRTLLAPAGARGVQSMLWDGKDNRGNKVPSGAYFCRLAVGGKEITRQIVMVR